MKWILPVTLFAVAATAQLQCEAENIVKACLASETPKFDNCASDNYSCQCAAQQAISTCYNNCYDDPRKAQAEGQVQIYCANAAVYKSTTTAAPTESSTPDGDKKPSATGTGTDAADPTSTDSDSDNDNNNSFESGNDDSSATDLAMNAGGLLLAVAGVMAVIV